MNFKEANKLLKKVFSSSYSRENFKLLVSNIFKSYNRNEKNVLNDNSIVNNILSLGDYKDNKGKKIGLYEIELKKENSLNQARVTQRNIISKELKINNFDAALVSFFQPNINEWRLSFVSYEVLISDYNTLKFTDYISPSKRQSFIVGPNEGTHTVKKQILPLLVLDEEINFDQINKIFQIEAVNDDFYNHYKELYLKLTEYLDKFIQTDEVIANDFMEKEVSTSDFAKKTLGQFVFLYFLQKKGWLKNKKNHEEIFSISKLFDYREKYGKNFFNDIMEPIFYESLSKRNPDFSIYSFLKDFEFPYLNGGLFEPIRGYDWMKTNIVIPDTFFKNNNKTKEGDIGDGLLDVFNRFNFTVHENDPLEQDIAVDPEMLGKVFENLLNIKDRKSKGAFYTPREIVQYMCQESLISYLDQNIGNIISKNSIEIFIREHSILQKNNIEKNNLNEISENAIDLDRLLSDIKICDPAVGSGAFPMGMLSEIVKARSLLQKYLPYEKSVYQLKIHTIGQSLYGVDLDPSAIEIARLRFWLSLVIEDENPTPLPNLEHKLMQGNSLLSSYEGIELFKDKLLNDLDNKKEKILELEKEFKFLEKEFLSSTNDYSKKIIKNRLKSLSKEKSKLESFYNDKPINQSLFQDNDFLQSKELIKLLQNKIESFLLPENNLIKNELKEKIDDLKWELIKNSISDKEKEKGFKGLIDKRVLPFFIWKLEFIDVFRNKGGFDIVIGNPPYIQLQKKINLYSSTKYGDLYKNSNYQVFEKTGDIYSLFYELGLDITRKNGHLFYITSNKWMRAAYGRKLRKLFTKKNPIKIIDLGKDIFKSATVDTNIILIQNKKNEDKLLGLNLYSNDHKKNLFAIEELKFSKISNLNSHNWIIEDEIDKSISQSVYKKSINIEETKIKINRGVVTGYNESFIVDNETKDMLIKKNNSNKNIIKKILLGKNLKRYETDDNNKYLLMTGFDTDIPKIYPDIYDYFNSFDESKINKIKNRDDKGKNWYNLRACSFYDLFERDKIAWGNISYNSSFCIVKAGVYINAPANFLTTEEYNIRFLIGVMNSSIFNYMFKKVGITLGEAYEWKKQYIAKVPIPQKKYLDKKFEKKIVDLVTEIETSKNLDEKKIYGEEIDSLFFNFYDFNKDQINIILNSLTR